MSLFAASSRRWGRLDFVVHAIAFSDKDELKGKYIDTTRANFLRTLDISCYSFTDVCRRAAPLDDGGRQPADPDLFRRRAGHAALQRDGRRQGSARGQRRYLAVDLGGDNIRVNAISAGPIKTLAASGIGDFRYILKWNQLNSPLKRNVTIDDVGGAGALSAERSVGRRHRRGPPRRLRLPCRRHEGRRCSGYLVVDAERLCPWRPPASTWPMTRQERRLRSDGGQTPSARSSASPPGARATGRRSASSSTACRRACRSPRRTSSTGSTGAGPGQSRYTTQRQEADGSDPLRRLRGRDDRHADPAPDREHRSALEGLPQHRRPLPPRPRRLHLLEEIRHPRLSRRRPRLGARDRLARRGRGGRAQGARAPM